MMKKRRKKTDGRLPLILSLAALFAVIGGIIVFTMQSCAPRPTPTEEPPTESTELLPLNTREPSAFTKEDGRIYYPGALTGIDVSAHQKQIDWQQVKEDGIDFAIIRAGFRGNSEGGLYEDDYFQDNIEGALDAGLKVGVYFFSQALSVAEAEEEAAYTLDVIRKYDVTLPVFFDWEEQTSGRTAGVLLSDVSDFAAAFCCSVEAAGYRAGAYFNQLYGYSFQLSALRPYEFWLAEYRSDLSFYFDVDYWQYSNTGRVAGIDTNVDLNLYFPHED